MVDIGLVGEDGREAEGGGGGGGATRGEGFA